MKRCPYCAEEIQDAAIKCRFCGSMLETDALVATPPMQSSPDASTPVRRFSLITESDARLLPDGSTIQVVAGGRVSDRAREVLRQKGITISTVPPDAADSTGAATTKRPWTCPRCGSDQIQRASVVHSSGTSAVKLRSAGVAIGGTAHGGLVGAGVMGTSSGTMTSELAAQMRPPRRPNTVTGYSVLGMLIGLCAGLLGSCAMLTPGPDAGGIAVAIILLSAIGGAVLGALRGGRAEPAHQARYEDARRAWERAFVCLKCHERFRLDDGGLLLTDSGQMDTPLSDGGLGLR